MKKIMPIILIVLMVLSFYMLYSERAENVETYNGYIEEARMLSKDGVVSRAAQAYDSALTIKESFDIRLEKAKMYDENEYTSSAITAGEELVKAYPKEPAAYEFLLEQYLNALKYKEFFQTVQEANSKHITSETISQLYTQAQYYYEFGYSIFDEVTCYSGGLWAARDDDLWGYLSSNGRRVISYKYKTALPYSLSTAAVQEPDGTWYYIDTLGEKNSVPDIEGNITYLGIYDTHTVIAVDNSYGYYSKNYKYEFGDYSYAGPFNCGVAPVKQGESWSIINTKGENVSSSDIEDVKLDAKGVAYRNNRAFVCVNGEYVMVDVSCNKVGTQVFSDAQVFLSSEPAAVKIGSKWGFVDVDGNVVIEAKYDNAHSFQNGFAAVCKNERWGFINLSGDLCIDFAFDDVLDFNDTGMTFVRESDFWKSLTVLSLYY